MPESSNTILVLPTFEQALEQLEGIVQELEEGQTGLAEALARYEQGVRLLRQCYGLLEHAERKIELLCEIDAAGNVKTEPFDDQATTTLDEKAQIRGSRRSRPTAPPRKQSSQTPQNDMDEPDRLF